MSIDSTLFVSQDTPWKHYVYLLFYILSLLRSSKYWNKSGQDWYIQTQKYETFEKDVNGEQREYNFTTNLDSWATSGNSYDFMKRGEQNSKYL